jgi:hypothetical protein
MNIDEKARLSLIALVRLKGMRIGDPIQGIHLEAIHFMLGHLLDLLPDPSVIGMVEFPEKKK